jgi:hypothetical protein
MNSSSEPEDWLAFMDRRARRLFALIDQHRKTNPPPPRPALSVGAEDALKSYLECNLFNAPPKAQQN